MSQPLWRGGAHSRACAATNVTANRIENIQNPSRRKSHSHVEEDGMIVRDDEAGDVKVDDEEHWEDVEEEDGGAEEGDE